MRDREMDRWMLNGEVEDKTENMEVKEGKEKKKKKEWSCYTDAHAIKMNEIALQ